MEQILTYLPFLIPVLIIELTSGKSGFSRICQLGKHIYNKEENKGRAFSQVRRRGLSIHKILYSEIILPYVFLNGTFCEKLSQKHNFGSCRNHPVRPSDSPAWSRYQTCV